VNSRLTLNVGLRWDRFGSPSFRDGLMWNWNWDIETGNIVIPPGTETEVRPLYPKNIPIVTGQVSQNSDSTNFGPRIGVAWRPFGEQTVVHGGYGLYTETLGWYSRLNTGGPFDQRNVYQFAPERRADAVPPQSVPLDGPVPAFYRRASTVIRSIPITGRRTSSI
jgi:hypothetical protein